jgi:hypothetical protein
MALLYQNNGFIVPERQLNSPKATANYSFIVSEQWLYCSIAMVSENGFILAEHA